MKNVLNTISSNKLKIAVGLATVANTMEILWAFLQILGIHPNHKPPFNDQQNSQRLALIKSANTAKLLDDMEINTRVLHGDFDMMLGDPNIQLTEQDRNHARVELFISSLGISEQPKLTLISEMASLCIADITKNPYEPKHIMSAIPLFILLIASGNSLIRMYHYGLTDVWAVIAQSASTLLYCSTICTKQYYGDTSIGFAPIYQGLDDLVARIIKTTHYYFRGDDLAR